MKREELKTEMLRLAGLYVASARETAVSVLQGYADAGCSPKEMHAQLVSAKLLEQSELVSNVARELEMVDKRLVKATAVPIPSTGKRRLKP